MNALPPDRRRDRTRAAIRGAFIDLLFERGYGKLSITEVIERANVGRSTFYEHFRTKHDLLCQSLAGPFGTLAATIGATPAPAALVPLLLHFRAQQSLGRTIFLPPTRSLLVKALAACIEPRLAERQGKPLLPLPLIALQIAEAQLGLVEAWALGRVASTADQIAAALAASSTATAAVLLG